MKVKYIALVFISFLFTVTANCQHQLYFETFNTTNTFTINDNSLGSNKGNNKWIIDTNYFAGGAYPNTTNENSTYGGTITGHPYSKYLHIYDSASGYLNDNYNPNDSSTRFAHMTDGICTKTLTNIAFNFYYLCPSISSYGTVWYSIDGGAWVSAGDTLRNRQKWQYATITNLAFKNKDNLRFGFLWHNSKSASVKDTSGLGIDDISLFGSYDSIAHPITCTITNFFSDSCLGGSEYVYFETSISDSTCNADWDVYMSNGNGNFPGSYAWYQPVADSLGNDLNQYWFLVPPNSFNTPGHCYKFKIVRTTYPYLTFLDSVCFPFDSCPGYITTIDPPALDSHVSGDTVCAGSVVDIGFYSTGLYSPYNVYYAELIDSTGYHTAKIDTIGNLVSNVAYTYPPGDVISTIPDTVPAGCNYYVRIVSSTPNRTPNIWGPFCIQHCDILTNKQQGFQVCLGPCSKDPGGYDDTIAFNVHEYDSLIHYNHGNKFEVQLIAFSIPFDFYYVANTGLLGVTIDTASGKMLLHVPCPDTLNMYGIQPGVYYARIIADSSIYPDSALGTLVHITIGEPADSMYLTLTVTPNSPPPYCAGHTTLTFNPVPDDAPGSTYTWWITDKTGGTQKFNNWTADYLGYTPPGADTFQITCQENSFGCLGPKFTFPDTIVVLGEPNITKTGPTTVCLGDTGTYSIPFENATNYAWKISAPAHADTSTNVLKIKFDTTGTVRVSVTAFNSCFTDSAVWSVNVVEKPSPIIKSVPSASTICAGTLIKLTDSAAGATSYSWSTGTRTSSIKVTPTTDTSYWVGTSNRGCTVYDTVKFTVLPIPAVNVSYCIGDSVIMNASGAQNYSWSPTTGLTIHDSVAKGFIPFIETFTVVGTTNGCADTVDVSINPAAKSDTISSATAINSGQSVQLTVQGGNSWFWTPPTGLNNDTIDNPVATPTTTTVYTVVIRNSNGCVVTDTVTVDVNDICNLWVPDIFSPSDPNNHNTMLFVRCECPVSIDFIVFDRWGNKVFESLDINKGWDGTYNGKALNPGTYIYYVTGKTPDGKTLEKKGNVTLVR